MMDAKIHTFLFLYNEPAFRIPIILYLLHSTSSDLTRIMASFAIYYASKSSLRLFDLWDHHNKNRSKGQQSPWKSIQDILCLCSTMLCPALQKLALLRKWSSSPSTFNISDPQWIIYCFVCLCLTITHSFKNGALVSFTLSMETTLSASCELEFLFFIQSVSKHVRVPTG